MFVTTLADTGDPTFWQPPQQFAYQITESEAVSPLTLRLPH